MVELIQSHDVPVEELMESIRIDTIVRVTLLDEIGWSLRLNNHRHDCVK